MTQRFVTAGVLAAAALALVFAPWPLPARMLAIVSLAAVMLMVHRRRQAHPDVAAVDWRADGSWWLQWTGSDTVEPVSLRDSRVVGPVIALAFDAGDGGRSRQLILWPDSADREVLRRLRIRLARRAILAGNAPRDGAVH